MYDSTYLTMKYIQLTIFILQLCNHLHTYACINIHTWAFIRRFVICCNNSVVSWCSSSYETIRVWFNKTLSDFARVNIAGDTSHTRLSRMPHSVRLCNIYLSRRWSDIDFTSIHHSVCQWAGTFLIYKRVPPPPPHPTHPQIRSREIGLRAKNESSKCVCISMCVHCPGTH